MQVTVFKSSEEIENEIRESIKHNNKNRYTKTTSKRTC